MEQDTMDSFLKKCVLFLVFLVFFSTINTFAQEVEKASQEQITKWIEQLASENKEEAEAAFSSLEKNKAEAFSVLLSSLSHENKDIRWQSLKILASYTDKAQEIFSPLRERLKVETENNILRKIIALLCMYQNQEAKDALLSCVDHADTSVRSDVLWTLAVMGEKTLPSVLIERLKVEKSSEVKASIYRTLAICKDEGAIQTALAMFPDQTLQEEKIDVLMAYCDCASVVGNFHILAEVATGSNQDSVRRYALERLIPFITEKNAGLLIPVLWDSQIRNRRLAFQKLLETTIQSFDYSPDGGILERSVAIGKWEEWWKTVEFLSAFNETPDKIQQDEIKKQLLLLGEHCLPYFIEYYNKLTPANQVEILKILASWNKPEVVEHMIMVAKGAGEAKEVAVQTLAQFYAKDGNKKIQTTLKEAFANAQEQKKIELASYLACQNDGDAISFLQKSLKEESQAIFVLNLLEKQKIFDVTLNSIALGYLKSEKEEIRQKAFSFLLNIQQGNFLADNFASLDKKEKLVLIEKLVSENKASLEKLISSLSVEKDDAVKSKLCDALRETPKAQQELLKLLEAEIAGEVAKSALEALKKQEALTVSFLMESFKKQKDSVSQEAILQSLPVDTLKDASDFLKEVLQGKYTEEIRTQALRRLLTLEKTDDVVKMSLEALPQISNESLRLAWLLLLKNRTKEEHLPLLETLWKTQTQTAIKAELVSFLGTMPYAKALPLLQSILDQEKELEIKREALVQLVSFKKQETFEYLVKLCEKSEPEFKKILYGKMIETEPKKALPVLAKELESEKPEFSLYTLLAANDLETAQKMFIALLGKAKTDAERVQVLKVASALKMGMEEFDLLIGMIPQATQEVAGHLASLLDQISGIPGGYAFDKKEDQEKALTLWQNWKKDQTTLQKLLGDLLANPTKEEVKKELLAFGEKGLSAMAKAFPSAKSAQEKTLLLSMIAQFSGAEKVVRPFLTELDAIVRGEVYRSLHKLGDNYFIKQIPFHYLKESDKGLRVLLLSLMSLDQLALYQDELPLYIADAANLDLLAHAIQKSSLARKNSLLLQIAEKLQEEASFIQVFGMISSDLRANKIADITALLEKQEKPQITEIILAGLRKIKALAAAPLNDKAAYLLWYKNNSADLEKQIALEKLALEYLKDSSFEAEQKLTKLSSDEKKAVVPFFLELFAQKETSVAEKGKILQILATYGSLEAQSIFSDSLASEHAELRELAARNLLKAGFAVDSDVVKKAAEHEDSAVRFFAINAIGSKNVASLQPVLVKALEDKDIRVKEESLYWLVQNEFKDQKVAESLLSEKSPGIKSLAFTLAANLGMNTAMKDMITELVNPFPEVRKSAYQGLLKLSGQNFAYDPKEKTDKIQESISKWQKWLSSYEAQKEVARFAAMFAEEGIIKENVVQLILNFYKAKDGFLKEEILQKAKSLLEDKNALVRAGMISFVREIGEKSFLYPIAGLLLDEDAAVREAAYNALEKMSSSPFQLEKLPKEYDAKAAEEWKQAVQKWLPVWQQEENKHLLEQELAKLEKDAKGLGSGDIIWSQDQIVAAKKIIAYLSHPLLQIRSKALDAIKRFSKDIHFRVDGTLEDRNQDLEDIEKWLKDTEKKLEEQNLSTKDQIAEIQKKSGDLNTIEGCKDLQDVVDEMMDVDNPVLLKEYLTFLKKKGCNVYNLDIYAPSKVKEETFFKIADFLYEYKKRLTNAEKDAIVKEQTLKDAFTLKKVQSEVDFKLAQELISVLSHDSYSLRKKAFDVLVAIAQKDCGYQPDAIEAERTKALSVWQEWLSSQEEEMKKERAGYIEKIKSFAKIVAQFKKVENRETYQILVLMVDALKDKEAVVRETALDALKSFTEGNDFGYQSKLSHDSQTESIAKWQQWLVEQEKTLSYREKLQNNASYVKNMTSQVQTAEEAEKMETLVQSLSSQEEIIRKMAFEALSFYAQTHAQNEVRENFGYDPVAPLEVRTKPVSDWMGWYENKVKIIAVQEKERVNALKGIIVSLLNLNSFSTEDVELFSKLVNSLEDVAAPVRNEAFQSLKILSQGKTYDFDPAKNPKEQTASLKSWEWWTKRQKREVEEATKSRLQVVQSLCDRHPRFSLLEQSVDVERIVSSLKDRETSIREAAFAWLQKQSAEKFQYDPKASKEDREKQYLEVEEWLRVQKIFFTADSMKMRLQNGVKNQADLAQVKKLLELMQDKSLKAGIYSYSVLLNLAGKELALKAEDFPAQKEAILKKFSSWIAGEEEKIKLGELVASLGNEIKKKEDVNKAGILVESLDSPHQAVRQMAIERLNQLAQKTFAYKADASDKDRIQAIKEVETWYKECKEKWEQK